MTEFQPPSHAPTGVCSRWLGDSPCGAAATHHVIWDYEMRNGAICPAHVAEARKEWIYVGLHEYSPECAMAGVAVWDPAEDRCVLGGRTEAPAVSHPARSRLCPRR